MRTILFTVVSVLTLACTAGVSEASPPISPVAVSATAARNGQRAVVGPVVADQQVPEASHGAILHPTWYRSCGWANCSVYFNKRETRIASYGGALLSQLICVMLQNTPAALLCTAISWAVGAAGDSAVSTGRCVKISFSRWAGVVYWIGTYSGSRCS